MGNRFSTVPQYHAIIKAHGVLATMIFLFIIPLSVMIARFYSGRPGWAIRYHAQLNVFAGLLLGAVFILPFFAVGPKRSLTNPHHGIGVAIFVLFLLQLFGGRFIRHITKLRSLRVTIHQWSGRCISLLGIVQIPLGLTLYGSPKYLFILYTLWMAFLVLVYFILSYRAESRRERYMSGGRSDVGGGRITESEYFSDRKDDHGSKWKWLGALGAGAGIWALMRGRKKNRDAETNRSRSRSYSGGRGPEVIPSRRGSASYLEEEKYTNVSHPQKSGGGGFLKVLGGAAAAVGAGKLVSNWMDRRDRRRDDEYSAVSTETPRRNRPGRTAAAYSEFDSEMTPDLRRNGRADETQSSLLPPSAHPTTMAGAISAADQRMGSRRPVTPPQSHGRPRPGASYVEDSEYSSYVSPSRRPMDDRPGGGGGGGGVAKGLMAGLGMGWLAKKFSGRKGRREEEERLHEEEEMRLGNTPSRYTGDGYPSPTRRESTSRIPPPRRPIKMPGESVLSSEVTDSTVEPRPSGGYNAPPPPMHGGPPVAPPVLVPGSGGRGSRPPGSGSGSRQNLNPISMPTMPDDPHGILHSVHSEGDSSFMSGSPRRDSSRRRRAAERAADAAASRASELAANEEVQRSDVRDRYGSPSGRPVSVKLKMHDDKNRNVTLRRLTEEEAMAARSRVNSDSSVSALESPSQGRRYRRDSTPRASERRAGRVEEEDNLAPLSPPNPAFAKGARRQQQKDSAYYSGQPGQPAGGPSGTNTAAGQTVSSLEDSNSRATWSEMSQSPSGAENKAPSGSVSAADNRRRRRLERRRGSSSARPSGADMFD